jgi:hypothetical protein
MHVDTSLNDQISDIIIQSGNAFIALDVSGANPSYFFPEEMKLERCHT